jgi:hypothetical protein
MTTTQITQRQIKDAAINDAKVQAGAAIALSKIQNGTLLLLSNGTVALVADFNAGGYKLTNVADPAVAQDAATKAYVDSVISGVKGKASVKAASTANLTLSGTQTVDGIALVASDRILVKNQTTTSQNGVYVVQSGAWNRATDVDSWAELIAALVVAEEGAVNADKSFLCTVDQGGTIGTTAVTWVLFGSIGGLVVGNFVIRETPSGTVNGSNAAFALAFTPTTSTEQVFVNGVMQLAGGGNDYTISGSTITFDAAAIPQTGDVVRVNYIK